ncbi:hypothetical protein HK405_008673, partial [Cladochytrium tenue]
MRDPHFVFLGTGSSDSTPRVKCLTSPIPNCKACVPATRLRDPAPLQSSEPGVVDPDDPLGSGRGLTRTEVEPTPLWNRNRRGNTSGMYRYTAEDGRVRNILIDCGKTFCSFGAAQWFPRLGVDTIDAVILTHGHADAILGLDDLRQWSLGEGVPPIQVYLSAETLITVQKTFPYLADTARVTGGGAVGRLIFNIWDGPDRSEVGVPVDRLRPGAEAEFWIEQLQLVAAVEHGKYSDGRPFFSNGFMFPGLTYISDANEVGAEQKELIRGSHTIVLDGLNMEFYSSHMGVEKSVELSLDLRPIRMFLTDIGHKIEHDELSEHLRNHDRLAAAG